MLGGKRKLGKIHVTLMTDKLDRHVVLKYPTLTRYTIPGVWFPLGDHLNIKTSIMEYIPDESRVVRSDGFIVLGTGVLGSDVGAQQSVPASLSLATPHAGASFFESFVCLKLMGATRTLF